MKSRPGGRHGGEQGFAGPAARVNERKSHAQARSLSGSSSVHSRSCRKFLRPCGLFSRRLSAAPRRCTSTGCARGTRWPGRVSSSQLSSMPNRRKRSSSPRVPRSPRILRSKAWLTPASAKGNHIVASAIEHPSVLGSIEFLEKQGFTCTRVEVDAEGRVDPAGHPERHHGQNNPGLPASCQPRHRDD